MYTLILPHGLKVDVEVEEPQIKEANVPGRTSDWRPLTICLNTEDKEVHNQFFLWTMQNYRREKPVMRENFGPSVRLTDGEKEWIMKGTWIGWMQVNSNLEIKARLKFETIDEVTI